MEGHEAAVQQYHYTQPQGIRRQPFVSLRSIPPRRGAQSSSKSEELQHNRAAVRRARQHLHHAGEKQATTADTSTIGRAAVQPPVCGVQPGHLLSLRTSMGLAQARAVLERKQKLLLQQNSSQQPASANVTASTGQLKHARLQPLGVVGDEILQPEKCLGVVPVTSFAVKGSERRPKSSTAPATQLSLLEEDNSRNQHEHQHLSVKKVKIRKRSYSAIFPRDVHDVPSEALMELLSISRHTGLVPQRREEGVERKDGRHSLEDLHSGEAGDIEQTLVPIVSRRSGPGINVEVRGISKIPAKMNKERNFIHQDKHSPRNSGVENTATDTTSSPLEVRRTLPPISDPSSHEEEALADQPKNINAVIDMQNIGVVKQKSFIKAEFEKPRQQSLTSSRKASAKATTPKDVTQGVPESLSRMAVVCIGETKELETRAKGHRTKRLQSGKSRLSSGWSPPQDIQPIKGSPLNTGPIRKAPGGVATVNAASSGEGPKDTTTAMKRNDSAASSMVIAVNVSEFLLPQNEEKGGEQGNETSGD